ncbi:LacI family DNA-binding transcriptional regulator [Alteribacillus sp. HJP-4]|uniref:LacI family DNA-binding transcriptional regulator n=1 Tax=Alteribacillus sp. HJP-4 TaxID=2775394 RepID=UPI0035CD39A4
MASIKDVARLSGVSVTTVSRVMNNRGYIGKETRQRVEDAMNQLDYQPNQIARSLQRSQSNLIGVIVPDLAHPFFSELINSIEAYASEREYKIVICNSLQDAEKEENYMRMLRQNRADGVITCSHTLATSNYEHENMPVISFDRIISSSIPYVASDNYRGGELAAVHLMEKGCKNVLHISGPLKYDLLANRRKDAFELTSMKAGAAVESIEGAYVQATFKDNYQFIEEKAAPVLSDYDGIFCSNDILAYALYMFCYNHGIGVPEELKIIGYDNHSFTRMLQFPKLTTIHQPIDQLGEALAYSLINQIEKKSPGNHVQNIMLDVNLVKGNTT